MVCRAHTPNLTARTDPTQLGRRRDCSPFEHRVRTFDVAKFAVILAAAGKSSRFHDKNYKKPFAPLANKPVWLHSAEKFVGRSDVKQTLVVIAPENREHFVFKFGANTAILGIEVVDGGAE